MMILVIIASAILAAHSTFLGGSNTKITPTQACTCDSSVSVNLSTRTFQPHVPPFSSNYDEQVGVTFTQNFRSLEYNVTAVEQTDPVLGDGPAYLLNGLSDTGYWYQVGVSWDWSPGTNPGTGFDMNYEVFDSAGNSAFPSNGQGGVLAFSGPVNDGDVILLDLYFSNATQSVVMLAMDTNTSSTASVSYSDEDATFFQGLPGSVSNSNGFFTGLMTEWYHGTPYYSDESEAVYKNPNFAISSAWMWMDEFNANTLQAVFTANSTAPISFGDPSRLQTFSYNGTTEYEDAYEFISGALTNASLRTSSTVPLTFSFSDVGEGIGYSAPALSYVSDGTTFTTLLTQEPVIYNVDPNSRWNVSTSITGSTSGERWETDHVTSGSADSADTAKFVYYAQVQMTFGYSVIGGGTGFSAPSITYIAYGSATTTPAGDQVWADLGSKYQYSNPLPGSSSSQRWFTVSNGTADSPSKVSATYYDQYLVTFDVSFRNTEILPGLSLRSNSAGQVFSGTIVSGINRDWLDSGSNYSVPQSYSLDSGQRLVTNDTTSGQVSRNLTIALVYHHQFYIGIGENAAGGGIVSPSSGWYDSGTVLNLQASSAPGWDFEGWEGSGSDSVSGQAPSMTLVVGPGAPANETASFYVGVEIDATGPASVSYSDGSISGSVSGGAETDAYVPPGSVITLSASNLPFLTTFGGWSDGGIKTDDSSMTLTVVEPLTVTSYSGYDFAGIVVIGLIAVVVATGFILLVLRRRRTGVETSPVQPALPDSAS
jgi:Divergent InlB B-repeat domain